MSDEAERQRKTQKLMKLARKLERDGKLEDALATYKQAYLLNTQDLSLRETIADVLAKTNAADKAIRTYRLLAGYYVAAGSPFRAIAVCKKILDIDPSHSQTLEALAKIYGHNPAKTADGPAAPPQQAAADAVPPQAAQTPAPAEPASADAPPPPTDARGSKPKPEHADTAPDDATDSSSQGASFVEMFGTEGEEMRGAAPAAPPDSLNVASPVPLLSDLPPQVFSSLVTQLRMRPLKAGEVVVREAEEGTTMYCVVYGAFTVSRRQADGSVASLGTVGQGDFFGEVSLLTGAPRLATVEADIDGLLIEIEREVLESVCARYPAVLDRIKASHHQHVLESLLRASPLFQTFSDSARSYLVGHSKMCVFPPDTTVLEQGRAGDGLFFLVRGRCSVIHVLVDGQPKRLQDLVEGDAFGEISMLFGRPCTASVRTETQCTLLTVPREAFDELVANYPEVHRGLVSLTAARVKRTQNLLRLLA